MKFSEQIKTVRESLGLNQAEAAAILGCGKRTLEHWEAGTRTPLEITQEGAMNRLRATKRPRTRKGQNQPNPMTALSILKSIILSPRQIPSDMKLVRLTKKQAEWVSDEEAARWLLTNEHELPENLARLEDEITE